MTRARRLLVLAAACLPLGCSERADEPRGVLLVTIDTCRADRIGCYGAERCETPSIDGVAEEGVVFLRTAAPSPVTLPSHASILTGLYPDRHGLRDNGAGRLPDEAVTLAEVLQGEGWDTAAFVAAVPVEARYGTDQGFERYDDEFVKGDVTGDLQARLHSDQRTAGEVGEAAVPWLRAASRGDRPFFAWVHFYDPHAPYLPPSDLAERYGTPSYEGEVAFVDRWIGELLDALGDARGQTIVVVTADHGESLGEHGEATHGFLLYESAVSVPWIMAGPGVPRGQRVEKAVSLVQVMPTVLEVAGVPIPDGLDGRSALAAGDGDVFAEALFPRLNFGWSGSRSIRAGRWKYIEAPRPELFDLESDPNETRNVVAEHPEAVDELRERLHRHFGRGGALSVTDTPIDEEARARLEGLGYLGVGGGAAGAGEDPWDFTGQDPKDMVTLFDDFQMLPNLIMSRRDEEARGLVASLTSRDPGNPAIPRRVAQLYLRARNWKDAREVCRQVLELDPDDPETRRGLGTATMRLGDREGAAAVFRDAVRREPDDALAWAALGVLLAESGECAEASRALERASSAGVETAPVATDVAGGWADCGKHERALELYDRALESDPTFSPAVNGKALLLSHAGRPADAVVVLRAALEWIPDDVETLNNLAWILADTPIDAAEALRHARRAAELAPEDPSVLDTLGWAAIRSGRPTEAIGPLRQAWEATADAEVRAHLGIALCQEGREEEGRPHVRAALAERETLARIPEVGRWR